MSSIRLATASNVRAFQRLSNKLSTSNGKWTDSIDHEALNDEFGRLRVWSGNLGALQKGHSSLDYRLRDSPLLSDNALKFLKELEENLDEAYAVVSGARLPYEEQPRSDKDEEEEDDNDDGFFSEDEEEDDGPSEEKTELSMRFGEVVDIIDNLYKLSVRIRMPTIRSRSLKAASYQPTDPETGVNLLDMYAEYDLQHTKELIWHLRQPHTGDSQPESDYFVTRLSKGITLRRRQFKYWKRHRDKLSISAVFGEGSQIIQPVVERPDAPQRIDTLEVNPENPIIVTKEAPSHKTGKTLLSGTEATQHHQSLDEMVDTKSVTSYAVTVKDIQGRGVDLPPPPKGAGGEKDFECPYCFIICPARYGRGRAWRTHLLQDLQPYVCTYPDCEGSGLFRSRREWVAHEAGHRKAWRCSEHPTAIYKSPAGLENHLRRKHLDSFPESQLNTIVKVGETSTVDVREKCPVCFAPADTEGMGDFQNHIANHLERIATFALPNGNEDAADGASSAASRGRSGRSDSTGSQNASEMSLPSDASDETDKSEKRHLRRLTDIQSGMNTLQEVSHPLLEAMASSSLLSVESLRRLPDESQNRLDTLLLDHTDEHGNFDEQQVDDTPAEIQEHLDQREDFRTYLMSLPNAQSVRFFRRYGWWKGHAIFTNENAAAQALDMFNRKRYPQIKIHQVSEKSNKLKFGIPGVDRRPLVRQSTAEIQDEEEDMSVASGSITYDVETEQSTKRPIISVADVPTLRSLYRSRKLLQRDQSYAPNDTYNRLISFCYYDLTRLKVDAIVNSANRAMTVTETATTLNHIIHKAAGPEMTKEAKEKGKGKIKPGQSILTGGYNLPSTHVIHTARPRYTGSTGMGQFNILTECYRSVMTIASEHGIKTIAFPCVGTGGCGFPPRVAARVALQEVRELLDSHRNHPFERIIFCVNSAVDEKAYMDFFPVFFPPTHADLDIARSSNKSLDHATLATQMLETRVEIQKVSEDLLNEFSSTVPDFDKNVLSKFGAINSALASIREFLLGSQDLKRSLGDLNLFCSVMSTLCGSIAEITERSGSADNIRDDELIWNDYNSQMVGLHETDLLHFLIDCRNFVQCLDDILTRNGTELDEMTTIRQKLKSYAAKQKLEFGEGVRDHLNGVLYAREYQRGMQPQNRDIVRLDQIPSVSRLYQLGDLEEKATLARPSVIFNQTVYLAREDITKLQVDVMVNSTDMRFSGMGTLDRSVFQKGGPELQEDCGNFGVCKEGDVKLTAGYLLPAKHILHAVPSERYRTNTKDILRKIYREVLHMSVSLRATSIAIPSIGTGTLNYPLRDTASLAMQEVKLFLESVMPNSLIEKIVFVVYSSNDEFIYKSLLPVYFPPINQSLQAQPFLRPVQPGQSSISPEPRTTPRRTLFGSVGEAFRNVRFGSSNVPSGQQPAEQEERPINTYEEHALIGFEAHAQDCIVCKDVGRLYDEGKDLCEDGYPLAQTLHWYMDMSVDQNVYTKSGRVKLEIPADLFPLSLTLLTVIEASSREESRSKPFVSLYSSYSTVVGDDAREEDRDLFGGHHEGGVLKKPGERRLSDLQSKLQALGEAASRLQSRSHEQDLMASPPVGDSSIHELSAAPAKTKQRPTNEPLSPLAKQILSHLTTDLESRPGSYIGQHTKDIASALHKSVADISAAIEELAAQGHVHNTIDGNTWVVSHHPKDLPTLAERRKKSNTSETKSPWVREAPEFHDTPPSPTTRHRSSSKQPVDTVSSELELDIININDYFTYPSPFGARWTRIDKRLVDAQVLTEADEEFDDTEDSLVVHRVLRRGEIRSWAEQTRDLRKGKEESKEGGENFEGVSRRQRPGRRESGDDLELERVGRVFTAGRKSTRDEEDRLSMRRGGEKDREQEMLDRLLAGDVRENELRRFEDADGR
ncbi:hypothetical protein P153DRAFT_397547 [Dothidotthia symphoricarpi CBS 119687]|uniref:Macro domain-containing protein n=1 Tax=Dothidotthia symphoricarpi CBS 119687 TaxID=1392245 RepID=A0A6A6AC84_9PLEO|nr:uncharacterized protein P153DRAFT_397547 [Dothidotthia symphoricarpi CBS 119687]KAF2128477.1 hypothetical protein P153DRAFT_397547 [Dothidotthia symphoricarpi CBS 119687]